MKPGPKPKNRYQKRHSFYCTSIQSLWLEDETAKRGMTISEVLEEALDLYKEKYKGEEEELIG